jgi:hypothetical protein
MLENTLTQYDDLVLENGTYSFWHIGEALQSSVPIWTVNTETGGYKTAFVTQFKLTDANDPNNTQYVLCCDLGTATDTGTGYYIENVDSAGYYQGEEAADHIKAIAYNGYWGTSGDGRGSLASVKKLLSDAVTEQQKKADGDPDKYLSSDLLAALTADNIAALTDGMALSATQAAIWTFANSGTYKVYDVVVGNHHYVEPYYYYKEVDDALYCYRVYAEALTEEERSVLQGLYEVLVNLGSDYMPQDTTTIISEDNFATDTAIIIKDKTDKKSGGKSVYDTDVTFSLAVTPADNDDLIVTVIDSAGNAIATRRIAGNDAATNYGFLTPVDQVYTIEDLEIAEGTKITLNLTGMQNLNEGVYLYTASVYNKAQTFVGVAKGSKKVDLAVSIKFYTENMEVYADVQSDDDPIPPTPTPTKPDPTIPVISVGVNPGSEPAGEHDPQPVLDPEYKELFEEDVPLDVRYMIPRTGDNMALYLAISMISGMSLAAVTISKKRSK